jgi:hypothetical protein
MELVLEPETPLAPAEDVQGGPVGPPVWRGHPADAWPPLIGASEGLVDHLGGEAIVAGDDRQGGDQPRMSPDVPPLEVVDVHRDIKVTNGRLPLVRLQEFSME